MIAYFVHDSKKETDIIVLPDMRCSVAVDAERMETFISVKPDFPLVGRCLRSAVSRRFWCDRGQPG